MVIERSENNKGFFIGASIDHHYIIRLNYNLTEMIWSHKIVNFPMKRDYFVVDDLGNNVYTAELLIKYTGPFSEKSFISIVVISEK